MAKKPQYIVGDRVRNVKTGKEYIVTNTRRWMLGMDKRTRIPMMEISDVLTGRLATTAVDAGWFTKIV